MAQARREMDEQAMELGKLLSAANVNHEAATARIARLEEQLATHRTLLTASRPCTLAPGDAERASGAPPPPPAMAQEIDARFEGLTERFDTIFLKGEAHAMKIKDVEDIVLQITSAGAAKCPCTTGQCPCRCGQAAGVPGLQTPGARPAAAQSCGGVNAGQDPMQKDDAWQQYQRNQPYVCVHMYNLLRHIYI